MWPLTLDDLLLFSSPLQPAKTDETAGVRTVRNAGRDARPTGGRRMAPPAMFPLTYSQTSYVFKA